MYSSFIDQGLAAWGQGFREDEEDFLNLNAGEFLVWCELNEDLRGHTKLTEFAS